MEEAVRFLCRQLREARRLRRQTVRRFLFYALSRKQAESETERIVFQGLPV